MFTFCKQKNGIGNQLSKHKNSTVIFKTHLKWSVLSFRASIRNFLFGKLFFPVIIIFFSLGAESMFRDGCEQSFGLKVCFFSGKYKKSLSKNLFFGLNQVSELGDWFFQMCWKNLFRWKKCTFSNKNVKPAEFRWFWLLSIRAVF